MNARAPIDRHIRSDSVSECTRTRRKSAPNARSIGARSRAGNRWPRRPARRIVDSRSGWATAWVPAWAGPGAVRIRSAPSGG